MTDAVEVLRIDSLEDERLDAYVRLTERELRCVLEPQKGIFIAESAKVIERAVRAGYEPVSFLLGERWLDQMMPLFERLAVREGAGPVPVFVASMELMERLTGFNVTRGALAAFRRPRQIPVDEFLGGVVEAAGERPVRGKGYYVGTYMALCALERYWWGEGEMKFFLDGDEEFPTVTSTGAEDYFGGAWAFLDRPPHALPEAQCFNTLFAGYPYRSTRDATRDRFSAGKPNPNPMLATNDDALPRHGLYRWHLPDPISFKEDLRVTFQDLGNDDIKLYEREDDISTVAYWYQSEPHAVLAPFAARQDRVPR